MIALLWSKKKLAEIDKKLGIICSIKCDSLLLFQKKDIRYSVSTLDAI